MSEHLLPTATDAQRMMTLPLRLQRTVAAKTRGRLILSAGILAVLGFPALIVGVVLHRLFHDDLVTYVGAAIPPLALIVGYQILKWRFPPEKDQTNGPKCRIDIFPTRILCRGSVDEDATWSSLTRFRWVLAGADVEGHDFKRADLPDPPPPSHSGAYWIEAAKLTDDGATSEFGFYDRPQVQFELADFCQGAATRARAEQVVDWLNDLRARADQGDLAPGAVITVPNWLNAATIARDPRPDSPATISDPTPRGRREPSVIRGR
ncbi:MAG: hypothetical protein IPK59_16855 [Rhodospirillaceae bacterium]|nr:hypothetical protein [Rhodospirillaceae bacterium]